MKATVHLLDGSTLELVIDKITLDKNLHPEQAALRDSTLHCGKHLYASLWKKWSQP